MPRHYVKVMSRATGLVIYVAFLDALAATFFIMDDLAMRCHVTHAEPIPPRARILYQWER